jgi:hypothetical protein
MIILTVEANLSIQMAASMMANGKITSPKASAFILA